ncbi:hypothetical protein BJY52DRAFT_1294398 [Lactarius psammicola]|nr:hypothetical protein BJY52DRAFT_1294398 [Lactarius psammicola]
MSLTTTTTAMIRQSSRLTRSALPSLCRRLLVAHFATPNSCPAPLFDKLPLRRTFVTTRPRGAAPTPTPTTIQAVLRRSPTAEDIENAELDLEPLAQTDAQLALTERAAEQLCRISSQEEHSGSALRVSVESGGCHGYQYRMELTRESAPEDYEFGHPLAAQARVVVDAVSLTLLRGSTIDFATELIGSSFRVIDNPQAVGAGCGCGVSWEAKA